MLYLLGILLFLAIPVSFVLALVALLKARRVQKEFNEFRAGVKTDGQYSQEPIKTEPAGPTVISEKQSTKTKTSKTKTTGQITTGFEVILGGQWLTWTGILALFFGTAFFLAVSLGESSLAGLGQVLIGAAVGLLFIVMGHRLCSSSDNYLGLGLLGGGLALLFLASFASYGFHRLVPLLVVFPLLLTVAIVGALLALRRNSLTIAALTLVGAIIAPLILVNQAPDRWAFDAVLPYLVAVNLGAVLVGLRRRWEGLTLGAFLATLMLVSIWWAEQARYDVWALFSVTGSWLVFGIAPWLQRTGNRFWSYARGAVLTTNGLVFGLFCYYMMVDGGSKLQGGALVVLAIIYFSSSALMKKYRGANAATRISHSTGAALAALAIPVLLDMAWVTIGWTMLASILIIAGLREKDFWQRITGLCVLVIGLFRVVFLEVPTALSYSTVHPLMNGKFIAGLVTLALTGWTYWAYHRYADRLTARELAWRPILLVVGVLVMFWKLSLELAWIVDRHHILQGTDAKQDVLLWLLLLWTVYGLAVTGIGLWRKQHLLRKIGYGILGLATAGTFVSSLFGGIGLVRTYLPVANLPMLQGLAITAALLILAKLLASPRGILSTIEKKLWTPALLTAVVLLFVKVSLEVMAYFHPFGAAQASDSLAFKGQLTLSVVWGLYSGLVVGIGFVRRFAAFRHLGMILLGLTVFKVFLIDMQSLESGYRILAFIVLGVLLLGVSRLYQKDKLAKNSDESTNDD